MIPVERRDLFRRHPLPWHMTGDEFFDRNNVKVAGGIDMFDFETHRWECVDAIGPRDPAKLVALLDRLRAWKNGDAMGFDEDLEDAYDAYIESGECHADEK